MGHREVISNFELRIAKFRSQKSESRIQNIEIKI